MLPVKCCPPAAMLNYIHSLQASAVLVGSRRGIFKWTTSTQCAGAMRHLVVLNAAFAHQQRKAGPILVWILVSAWYASTPALSAKNQ